MPLPAAALGLLSFLLAGGWDVLKRELDQNKADDPGLKDWILPITAGTLGFAAAGGAVGPRAVAPAVAQTTTQTYKSLGAGRAVQKALPEPPTPLMSTPQGLVRMVGPINGKYYPPIVGGSSPPQTSVPVVPRTPTSAAAGMGPTNPFEQNFLGETRISDFLSNPELAKSIYQAMDETALREAIRLLATR